MRQRSGFTLIGAVLLAYALALQSLAGAWAQHAASHPGSAVPVLCLTEQGGGDAPAPAGPAHHPASSHDECCLAAACHAAGALLAPAEGRVPGPRHEAADGGPSLAAAGFAPSGPPPAAPAAQRAPPKSERLA
ncbi:hypothetical protein ABEG18_04810 [Alsobacter sp. KACC 23698]|uniref:DUF2946 domain-containing protein n=1 Tax=Alsobacter sp. KACC 23698 TaxID=3149229 RepID=A0AAU7JIS2_9HYPH